MTGEAVEAPGGYRACPNCGHHTSAFAGACTVILPAPPDDPQGRLVLGHCGCDCVEATEGKSLRERLAESLWGPRGEAT